MFKYLGHFGIVISISDSDGAADTLLGEKKEQDKADEQGMLEISNIHSLSFIRDSTAYSV